MTSIQNFNRFGAQALHKKRQTAPGQQIQPSQKDEVLLSRPVSPLTEPATPRFGGGLVGPWSLLGLRSWGDLRRRDPDLDEFLDIMDGDTTEDYLMDQIIEDQFQIGEDGSVIINKPRIDIPDFRHGNQRGGGSGVGSGDGEVGDEIGEDSDEPGKDNKPGDQKGDNPLAPWQHRYAPSEMAQIIGNQFGLPFLKPSIDGESTRFKMTKDATKIVPPGDLDRKKTFRNAVKRTAGMAIARGEQPDLNNIIVEKRDKVYKAIEMQPLPNIKVAVIYVADVSASVDENLRTFTRITNRFVSFPLKYKYGQLAAQLAGDDYSDAEYFGKDGTKEGGLKERFVIYTTEAEETSEQAFYKTKQSGGTACASGIAKAKEIIEKDYPPSDGWNVYVYHFSDGDNWGDDNPQSVKLMRELFDMGLRYFGHCDLGMRDTQPSSFRKGTLGAFKEDPRVGSIGIPRKQKYSMDDYKAVVGTFLPPNKQEPEWYDN